MAGHKNDNSSKDDQNDKDESMLEAWKILYGTSDCEEAQWDLFESDQMATETIDDLDPIDIRHRKDEEVAPTRNGSARRQMIYSMLSHAAKSFQLLVAAAGYALLHTGDIRPIGLVLLFLLILIPILFSLKGL